MQYEIYQNAPVVLPLLVGVWKASPSLSDVRTSLQLGRGIHHVVVSCTQQPYVGVMVPLVGHCNVAEACGYGFVSDEDLGGPNVVQLQQCTVLHAMLDIISDAAVGTYLGAHTCGKGRSTGQRTTWGAAMCNLLRCLLVCSLVVAMATRLLINHSAPSNNAYFYQDVSEAYSYIYQWW